MAARATRTRRRSPRCWPSGASRGPTSAAGTASTSTRSRSALRTSARASRSFRATRWSASRAASETASVAGARDRTGQRGITGATGLDARCPGRWIRAADASARRGRRGRGRGDSGAPASEPPPLGWLFGDRRRLADVDVLYVHGWSDYFFQKRLARFWTDQGARFYALDLRKYGRSLRPDRRPATSPTSRPTTTTSPPRSRRWGARVRHGVRASPCADGTFHRRPRAQPLGSPAPGRRSRAHPQQPVARVPAERDHPRGGGADRGAAGAMRSAGHRTAGRPRVLHARAGGGRGSGRSDGDQLGMAPHAVVVGPRRVAECDPRGPRPRRCRPQHPRARVRRCCPRGRPCRRDGRRT